MTAGKEDNIKIVEIAGGFVQIFERLVQCYEAEFSSITGKYPTGEGLFPLDTNLDEGHVGYLLYVGEIPTGFNIIATKGDNRFEVCEFYIIPVARTRHLGYTLAADVFSRYPGSWEVKQIAGADSAKAFWRKTIGRYTAGAYVEDIYHDEYWGTVTRQCFTSPPIPVVTACSSAIKEDCLVL